MYLRALLLFLVFTPLAYSQSNPVTSAPTTESGPLPPPDLSLTRASTILHPDDTKTVTLYDAEKRESDVHYYNSNGSWRAHIIYTLGEDGKIKSGQFLDKKGKPGVRTLYRYDGSDRVVEESHYNTQGVSVRRMVYEYGLGDRVMKTIAYDSAGNVLGVYTPKRKASGGPPIVKKKRR